MERCQTCSHWNPNGPGNVNADDGQRACDRESADTQSAIAVPEESMRYTERSPMLYTGPLFGCVHHKRVTNPQPNPPTTTKQ